MKYFWFICLLACSLHSLNAQKTLWADAVINVSSEYQKEYYSAEQALGVPNGFFNPSLDYMAWTPAQKSSGTEHLHVSFKKSINVQQIAIYQMGNPGAISKIWLFDLNGKKHKVYENDNPKADNKSRAVFRKRIPKTSFKVKELKVELSTKAIAGANQIDAIAISSAPTEINLKKNELAYNSPVGQVEKLGATINSNYAERMPLISPDGKALYFARKKHPQNIGTTDKDDIWVSYLSRDGSWSKALNVGAPLNNENHNFVLAIDPSGKKLYLANDYKGNKKDAISVSQQQGRSWKTPVRLDIEDHYNDSKFVNYHLSNDGNILLMAVQREEGFGDRDIYVSFKSKNNNWSKPKNIGSKINTVASENAVFLASDNKTIYFSSNGHAGYGGFDIFISQRLDESWQKWSEPKNLGRPINSEYNDLSFSIPASGDYAYFSAGSIDNTDLYRIKLPKEAKPEPVTLLSTRFVDAETGKPVKAEVVFEELGARKNNKKTKDNGKDTKYVVPTGEDISFYAEAEGYFPVSDHINNSYSEIEELDYDNDSYSTNEELRKLQSKLEGLQGDIQKLNQERRKTNLLIKKQDRKEEKNTYKEVFKNVEKEEPREENEELLALMKKYNIHYNKESTASKRKTQQPSKLKKKSNPTKKPSSKNSSTALAEMQKKYNKHYNKDVDDSAEVATSNSEEVEEEIQETTPGTEQSESYEYTVEDFEKVREELIKELVPQIKMDVYDEYYDQIKKEVRKELELELKNDEMAVVEEKVKTQMLDNWEEEVQEVTLSEEEKEQIQTELWFQMQDQLKEELKDEISDDIREELERETIIAFKEKEQELIQQKIEKEIVESPKPKATMEEKPKEKVPSFEELEKSIKLVPLKVGAVIPMNNIFFDANQASLKNASYAELDRVINFLFKNEKIVVEIGGHTNGWCSHEFASELSRDRAEEVMNYIIENGINESRIQSRGYGKTKPIATNDTLQGRKQNQRVELKILEIID